MKKILLSTGIFITIILIACNEKSEKSEMSISTTISDESGQAVKKEIIAIKENINGQSIDLKMDNNAINSLTIDGKTIAKEDYKKYEELIAPILKKLPTPPPVTEKPSTSSESEENDNDLDKVLEGELKKDGFITDGNVKYDFDLSKESLIINGKTQPNDVKERYLKLFKDKTGKELGQKFHIKLQENKISK